MKIKRSLAAILAVSMCMASTACSEQAQQTKTTDTSAAQSSQSETQSNSETSADTASSDDVTENNTAEEKTLSGKVTVYMPSPAGLADKLAEGFTAATGVEVETFQGTTGEILARLEAEEANPVADVVILASWSDGLSMKNDGKIMSYSPANADKAVDGWIDSDSMLFGYSASAVGVIYNTSVIPELSADWSELANEEYKDMLAIPDPEKSGACKDFAAGFVNKYGWDTFEGMAANGMIVPGANKAALEAVTTGEVGILVAGVDYNAYSSMSKGEPLNIYYPAGGTVVNPRPAMIMNTAPNVDNAKAFIDYLYSDEAQQLVADAYLLPGRSDIVCENRANLADIPQIECDWDAMMNISGETAARINELCSK
ncbi:ABC transporter substrate-binding protein [Huintestinicola butyrica]|jgi:fe3+ abc transporter substrate-binding protein|uniref:ABC transporter substrate-binding protein n=1 Tax=Huintestinicola butyrica TaxID=2981728 RepID=UPI003F7D7948